VRDLVNTPAEAMGPAELAAVAQAWPRQHGAKFKQTVGDALLKANFPAIHAVGRAATGARAAPDRAELGQAASDPLLSLVGKGVCFDSGGLDIKPPDGMRLMKKDMGGAANALGLARWSWRCKLPVRCSC
jgi:leucyl aminopeptidase